MKLHWFNFKKILIEKKIPKTENQSKIVDIVEKILDFNKQQKGKGILLNLAHIARIAKVSDHYNLKILTPKQMLQRLPIALVEVKPGNTFENLLNKVRQIIYFLYRPREITIKV